MRVAPMQSTQPNGNGFRPLLFQNHRIYSVLRKLREHVSHIFLVTVTTQMHAVVNETIVEGHYPNIAVYT